MGRYFCSPVKLYKLFVNRNKIADKLSMQYDSSWYFSARGKAAYQKAKTVAEKTRYFYHYLLTVVHKIPQDDKYRSTFEYYQKLAFVMAHSMDASSVYGGYPNILKPEINPLVRYVQENPQTSVYGASALDLIKLFHENESPKSELPHPLDYLTLPEKDGSYSDLYKIERDIIATVGNYWSIYSYKIAESIEEDAASKTQS